MCRCPNLRGGARAAGASPRAEASASLCVSSTFAAALTITPSAVMIRSFCSASFQLKMTQRDVSSTGLASRAS